MLTLLVLPALATEILAGPFLQQVHPDSAWVVWETDLPGEARVQYGPDASLGGARAGEASTSRVGTTLHRVQLLDLSPGEPVTYRVVTGDATSALFSFTPPLPPAAEAPVRLVAMSDMQRDSNRPGLFAEVVADGVIPTVRERYGAEPGHALHGALLAGDLVDDGRVHSDWTEDFFGGGAPLFAVVPPWPVLGNHEQDDALYFEYFLLPGAGGGADAERYWTADVGNVRLIGLDSNHVASYGEQLAWLDALLAETCTDPTIDFAIGMLHHPHRSELWLPGENPFTGIVADALGQMSSECGVPSVHLFGHTHGYSRGAHREHRHLMVNVATGGGAIDRWGATSQANYADFSVSEDDYGFALIEVEAGDAPSLRLVRFSRGDPEHPLDNVVTDEVLVRRFDAAPATPDALWPREVELAPDCVTLTASPFADADGDAHAASQWQVATACDAFDEPLLDVLRQSQDRYFDRDLAAGDALTDEVIRHVAEGRRLCWRVRYRDEGLSWSAWSAPAPFRVGAAVRTPELLADGGAEEEGSGWSDPAGVLDAPALGVCGAPEPVEGVRVLAIGCGAEGGEVSQRVGVASRADAIDAGAWVAHLSGAFSSADGVDRTTVRLRFLADGGALLAESDAIGGVEPSLAATSAQVPVPPGTRQIEVVLARAGAAATMSFADALSLQLGPPGELACAAPPPVEEGCGCRHAGVAGVASAGWLVLALLAAARRRAR